VAMRMRRDGRRGRLVAVSIRGADFHDVSRQMTLPSATDVTAEIFDASTQLLQQLWDRRSPLRQLGVRVSRLTDETWRQCSLFDGHDYARMEKIDAAVDSIRSRFGENAICRARFLSGGVAEPLSGGLSRHRRTGVTKPLPEE